MFAVLQFKGVYFSGHVYCHTSFFSTGRCTNRKKGTHKIQVDLIHQEYQANIYIRFVLDNLLMKENRPSTMKTYLSIWRCFNKFVISLDMKPVAWEDCTSLFVPHLIDNGMQSIAIKSYVSAIKNLLTDDGYAWNDQKILLTALTKASTLVNEKVHTRLGIQCGLLEIILIELQRFILNSGQVYLSMLHKALFIWGCYG